MNIMERIQKINERGAKGTLETCIALFIMLPALYLMFAVLVAICTLATAAYFKPGGWQIINWRDLGDPQKVLPIDSVVVIYHFSIVTLHIRYPAYSIILLWVTVVGIYLTILCYADACLSIGILDTSDPQHNKVSDPVSCLYFSLVTWTTLGYGDYRPTKDFRLVAASEALLGYVSMSMLVAGVISAIRPKSPDERRDSR
jgi:hypothetical protein